MFCVVETVIPVTKNDEVLLELAGSLGVTGFERYYEAINYISKWFERARESAIHDVVFIRVYHNGQVLSPTTEDLPLFTHVAWKKMLNRDGEVLAEGAVMAFVTEKEAEDWVNMMRRQVRGKNQYYPQRFSVKHIRNVKPEKYL